MAIQKIGIPRGLMLYRNGILWKTFFENLGYQCIISGKSDRRIQEEGVQLAIDETCLPFKIYLGHVKELIGKCDAVFVPRMGGYEAKERMCTRYQSLPDLVENIFKLMPFVAIRTQVSKVKHCPNFSIMVILVVGAVAQIHRSVICNIIRAEKSIGHVKYCAVTIVIIQCAKQCKSLTLFANPPAIQFGIERHIGHRPLVAHTPIIVETIVLQVNPIASNAVQRPIDTSIKAAEAAIETQEICTAAKCILEIAKMSVVVNRAAKRHFEHIFSGYILGINQHKTTTKIGWILGRRRLDDYHVVELRRWYHVKRVGPRIGLAAWHGTIVEPYVVIALR